MSIFVCCLLPLLFYKNKKNSIRCHFRRTDKRIFNVAAYQLASNDYNPVILFGIWHNVEHICLSENTPFRRIFYERLRWG